MGKRKRRGLSSREERYNEMELLEEEESKMERINMSVSAKMDRGYVRTPASVAKRYSKMLRDMNLKLKSLNPFNKRTWRLLADNGFSPWRTAVNLIMSFLEINPLPSGSYL